LPVNLSVLFLKLFMKRCLLTLLFSWCFIANAQTTLSLDDDAAYIARYEKEVTQLKNDSSKAFGYLQLSSYCRLIADTVKIKRYLAAGKQLAGKNLFLNAAVPYFETIRLYASGNIPLIQSKLMEAEKKMAPVNSKEAFMIRGLIWHTYSTFQQMQGKENEATKNFIGKALLYAKKSENLFLIGNVNKSIGIGFMNADQRDLAAQYLNVGIKNIEQSKTDNPTRLETLVETYMAAAENDVYRKQLTKAKINLDKAYKILKPHPTSNLYYKFDYAQGIYYNRIKQYDKSLQYFEHGIALGLKDPQSVHSVNRLKYGKYETLSLKKDFKKAGAQLEDLVKSPYILSGDKKMYFKDLAKVYTNGGLTNQALKWSEKYIHLSDSLYEAKFQNDIIEMEKKYKEADNQQQIASLKTQKKNAELTAKNNKLLAWFLGIVGLFLLIVFIIIWQLRKNQSNLASQKLLEIEQKQQITLSKAMLDAEEKERNRLATDLHDGLGGMLAGVKINLSSFANSNEMENHSIELQKIISQLDGSVTELRNIARNMMPQTLINSGLETALKEFCDGMIGPNLEIDFEALNINPNIPFPKQAIIYRIVQEILTNILKHANATEIILQCSQRQNRFYITAEDNGKGFNMDADNLKSGMGLGNIKNRVQYLGGILDISSEINGGTTINIELDAN
jgi:two-component system NarL family sensor kinase